MFQINYKFYLFQIITFLIIIIIIFHTILQNFSEQKFVSSARPTMKKVKIILANIFFLVRKNLFVDFIFWAFMLWLYSRLMNHERPNKCPS